jgi:hypothetical protein
MISNIRPVAARSKEKTKNRRSKPGPTWYYFKEKSTPVVVNKRELTDKKMVSIKEVALDVQCLSCYWLIVNRN